MTTSILVVEVFHMKIHQGLAVSLFAAMVTLCACSFLSIAQRGYGKAREDIKSSMRNPSSYKGENVECYFDAQTLPYSYQYKITFSGENAFGGRLSATLYYGYNNANERVTSYGSDPSTFITASGRGEKQSVIA